MINILLLSYNNFGQDIIDAASHVLGEEVEQLEVVSVNYDDSPAKIKASIEKAFDKFDMEQGAIILSDIYGATHSNTACKLLIPGKINLVSGLNLPMLLRIMNYRNLNLDQLIDKAVTGGREGITDSSASMQLKKAGQ